MSSTHKVTGRDAKSYHETIDYFFVKHRIGANVHKISELSVDSCRTVLLREIAIHHSV